jgi:hypothetical protein
MDVYGRLAGDIDLGDEAQSRLNALATKALPAANVPAIDDGIEAS